MPGLQRDPRPRRARAASTLTRWQTEQGLDMDAEFESLRAEIQAIWDKQ